MSDRWKKLWEMSIPTKVKYFIWLVMRYRVVVRDRPQQLVML